MKVSKIWENFGKNRKKFNKKKDKKENYSRITIKFSNQQKILLVILKSRHKNNSKKQTNNNKLK